MQDGIIYRLNRIPDVPVKYPYIVVSDDNDTNNSHVDLVTINDFRRAKEHLRRRRKKRIGFEVLISTARKMDGSEVAKWLEDVRELHSLCHSSGLQFVLSSGSKSLYEMVSGPCLDAILKNCDIEPKEHWDEMNEWLDVRLSREVLA
jgi:RNase P/RNase MRP subunit p30